MNIRLCLKNMVSTSTIIRIGSRKSHLARYQAYEVALEIKKKFPQTQVQFFFKESLGDINLTDPLWKMPEKGVFTEDFVNDLQKNNVDLVVHSWKDLPTFEREKTEVIATLKRADPRDLLLVKKSHLKNKAWTLLCSSPRRQYNLKTLLPELLPQPAPSVCFENVRGNIPTRIRKFLEGEASGLILAKAALDRLLNWSQLIPVLPQDEIESFAGLEKQLRSGLLNCQWMILPLSENPPAAAQGALALEVSKTGNPEIKKMLLELNDSATFESVQIERAQLASLGGGCHQAIGIYHQKLPFGELISLRGKPDAGDLQSVWQINPKENLERAKHPAPVSRLKALLKVQTLRVSIPSDQALFVSKSRALPKDFPPQADRFLWAAGLKTWKKLAGRGHWVSGCSESLGEHLPPRCEILNPKTVKLLRLTHKDAIQNSQDLGTYELIIENPSKELLKYDAFYWTSGKLFLGVLNALPELLKAQHFCGPGRTYQTLQAKLPASNPPQVCLSEEEWNLRHSFIEKG